MLKVVVVKILICLSAVTLLMAKVAFAEEFNIPGGDLRTALDKYAAQTGVHLLYAEQAMNGVKTSGIRGSVSADDALLKLLKGTGFTPRRDDGSVAIVRNEQRSDLDEASIHVAAATAPTVSGAALETVTVTSSKVGGDIQNIPIAITAMSQEQLTATQTAGGPDLVRQVPNLNFTKTNFTGYDISIRGIGTEAISATTDPAVAVSFNDIPFIRNHFFEQEFYDVSQVEVLRGPQGTLYGRNATAGVVNLVSAKPTDSFEAMVSADIGNYGSRRLEGMINVPVVDDRLDIRVAGEWTKRQGYSFNETTDQRIDGRDLWSGRLSIGFKPTERLQMNFVWERFSEDDDRLRSSKQLCKTDPGPSSLGVVTNIDPAGRGDLSQGCLPVSLYSPDAFEVVNGSSLQFVNFLQYDTLGYASTGQALEPIDPYSSATQSRNLRVIQSQLTPTYKVKNDVVEFNADYTLTPSLTLTSQTGFNQDFLRSTEDFNRFNTSPGIFPTNTSFINLFGSATVPGPDLTPGGFYCDPQLGCSDRIVGEDLSQEHSWQLSQEFRLASHFDGPFNFSLGGNYLHYETFEDYYVFYNLLSMISQIFTGSEPGQYTFCAYRQIQTPHHLGDPNNIFPAGCTYIDPNPIGSLDGNGHNYFRSINPYILNSYAGFGEAYYQVLDDLKLTAGLRWTDDQKHFTLFPSWAVTPAWGYPSIGAVNQQWDEFTGRFVANWTPKIPFTDQSMFYASYSRGYKGGGANPPGPAVADILAPASEATHPLTFEPEFVNAYEAGTKNTLLDGSLTFNGSIFYYDYKNYQISEIVDRTSINLNFNANVRGAEAESTWEPVPGLRFNLAGGWEDTKLASGSQAIDLMDRTAGNKDWLVVKPFVDATSNCILPAATVETILSNFRATHGGDNSQSSYSATGSWDSFGIDQLCYDAYATNNNGQNFFGFDPGTAPNGGAGFDKNLAGNRLPNAPPFTASLGAQYTIPLTPDWAGTLRGDYYWQDYSWARVFNDNPYDRLRGYTNVNLTLIFTNQNGWQAMAYAKNIFNTTAITGDFLNSDDTGLTTNVFLTDPRLIGVRVTKNW